MRSRWLVALGAAGAGTVLLRLLDSSVSMAWLLGILVYAACASYFFFSLQDKRLKCCFGAMGAIAANAAALSLRYSACGFTGWDGLAFGVLAASCFAPAAAQSFIWLIKLIRRAQKPMVLSAHKAFVLAFLIMLCCWLPFVLALLPGVTGYDMQSQIQQITSGNYVNGHPIAHTLLIGLFYRFGDTMWQNPSAGVAVFTVCQALCLAGSMAYALYWLRLRECPRVLWFAILAVFSIAPQHAVMASSLTKDVLFAAALLMVTVELCRLMTEPHRAEKPVVLAADILLMVAAGLLRRNMALAFLPFAAVLVLRFRRREWFRRVFAVALGGMILALGCETALKKTVSAKDPTIHDTLAIPCQQLARVYYLYGLEHPVGYQIRETLPWAHEYTPERADAAKRAALVTGEDRLLSFIKLWGREAFRYPIEYIDAWLLTNKAYWDPTDTDYAYTYDEEEFGPRGVMTVNHNPYSNLEQYNWLPRMQKLCDEWFTENGCMKIWPVRIIVHPAVWTWLMILGLTWMVYERRTATMAWCLPAFYLCTLMLGPCALIRYCYCIMLVAPVMVGWLCSPIDEGVTM